MLETTVLLSHSPPHHKVSQCLHSDFTNGGTGSEFQWLDQAPEAEERLSQAKQSLLMPGSVLHSPPRGYEQDTNNSPKELINHQGQRASEAVHNSIKYSTCVLHIQLFPSFSCCKGSRLLRQSPSGQPITLFPMETQLKVCMRLSSRTGVLFYVG